jgi:micrococcal nuclease
MRKLLALAVLSAWFVVQPIGIALSQPAAPTAIQPPNGAQLDTFAPTLMWAHAPAATVTQTHLQVTPANGDGPGIDLVLGSADTSFAIPAPPAWYGLLPGMTYTWRVRASDAPDAVDLTDASWGEWSAPSSFRTPALDASTINLTTPPPGAAVTTATPTLIWTDSHPNAWYYEVQVSKDPGFGPGAFLYWELRHGGVTSPPRSYTIPAAFPLESGTRYSWRVRPRVQGDGAPVAWSAPATFTTPGGGELQVQVANVLSGDTIEVLFAGRLQQVRYLGIAAPAVNPPACYGAQAAARNSELVEGQTVRLVRDVSDTDAQGRLLRWVFVGNRFVNAELVRGGYARAQVAEPDTRFAAEIQNHQAAAQAVRAGLWGACP